jgi:LysM repeat protein
VDARRRRELTRFGAPVAFLAAVTVAVLLIKSALSGNGSEPATVAVTAPVTHAARRAHRTASTVRTTPTNAVRYYTIQPGDTLGSVAVHENTTVDELLRLNPGIDPHVLHSGQRIRVG